MLRVIASRSARAAKEYYGQSLKREDYYTEGQEITGEWQGVAAERLGLSGLVTQSAFEALCEMTVSVIKLTMFELVLKE